MRIDPSDLALEIVSIVIAIVLATAVGALVARYQAGERTRAALVQIRLEISHDHEDLRAVRSLHNRVHGAFEEIVLRTRSERLSFDAFSRTFFGPAPTGIHPFNGTTTAWELARSSNALDDLPYDLRATLQQRYAELNNLQALNTALYSRLVLADAPTEERPNFFFSAVAVSLTLGDVVAAEDRLAADDTAALHALASDGIR